MEKNFWQERWDTNKIGFHQPVVNPFLVKYLPEFSVEEGSRIFIPLCGKTLDISYLLGKGYKVVGAELVELAIVQLFEELNVEPKITILNNLKLYSAHNLDIFVGDIFDITQEMLGHVDLVFDRAALVALPMEMRIRYAAHLTQISNKASQLLITFEYDQNLVEGPPFSIGIKEVNQHYSGNYQIKFAESRDVEGGIKGTYPAIETTFILK